MIASRVTVLVTGATGSIAHLVVEEALGKGYAVRALVRDSRKARQLFPDAEVVVGDLTRPDTLADAVGGLPYTIVRPGWFDYNKPDEHRLVLLQGDRRQAGDPSDGVVARRQIAEVLVASLTSDSALRKTFELVATHGPAHDDLEPLFARLDADPRGALDGIHDLTNMPLEHEPQSVRDELDTVMKLSARSAYTALPGVSYAALAAAALVRIAGTFSLFLIGASALALLLIGIHNAWDTVTHVVVTDSEATGSN
jgi:NAD(P)-dependent dehydrogenase (short-subunit alcohol dehydrogenase family)